MKFLDPSEQILLPVCLSLRGHTFDLLTEMASEMNISVDELLSGIAEDSVIGLKRSKNFLEDVYIPDRCSMDDLIQSLNDSV